MLRSLPVSVIRLRALVVLLAALLSLSLVTTSHARIDEVGTVHSVDPVPVINSAPSYPGRDPHGVAIHPGGEFAVIVNEKSGSVTLVMLPTGSHIATIPVGRSPREVAIDAGRGLAVVTLAKEDRVHLIDLTTYDSIGTVPVGREPHGVAIDPDLGIAVVTNARDDTISILELDTRTRVDTIYVGREPRTVVVQGDERRAWVLLEKERAIRVIDLESRLPMATVPAGQWPSGLAIGAKARAAVIANEMANEVAIVDIDSLDTVATLTVGKHPRGVAIDDVAGRAYVVNHQAGNVSVIDLATLTMIDAVKVGKHPERVSVNGESRFAVVTHRGSDNITILTLPDTSPPVITIDYPPDQLLTNQPLQAISGQISKAATLTINGAQVMLSSEHRFTETVTLEEGANPVSLVARDNHGNSVRLDLMLWLDTVSPLAPDAGRIGVSAGPDGKLSVTGEVGSVEPDSLVRITNQRTGKTVSAIANAYGSFQAMFAAEAGDAYIIRVIDAAGNPGDAIEIASGLPRDDLPPEPSTVAPPLDPTAATTMIDAIAFLYSGSNPIQRGVAADAFDPVRIAVVRGRIRDRDGAPLSGVRLTVQGHPQLGHSLSRSDGAFDLAVNGGGRLTVNYDKAGYLPVQRELNIPWQDFTWLPDVVMIPLDTQVTPIDLTSTAPVQIARGSRVTDADGTRQATLLFARGTQAELVMPDGTTEPLATLNVRATEYTIGAEGPAAMPGVLPPTSGYTYAVELSIDEAMAVGASEVRFDRPVYSYTENFPDFPVGGKVPAGWYDRDRSAWIPSDNGLIVRVLSISGGMADLDVQGGGLPAGDAALAALGITDDERRVLAVLYNPGQSLWRVPVSHFTPWDYNWPFGPPDDAVSPRQPPPRVEDRVEGPDCRSGSVIECQNQTLRKTLRVAGTSFSLTYASDRVPGRRSAFTLDIPLSGGAVPASLRRIELEIVIAGRRFMHSYPAANNLHHRFVWDGKDAYGRQWPGSANATVRTGYVYGGVYQEPAEQFAGVYGIPITGSFTREEVTFWQEHTVQVGSRDARAQGTGGWSFNIHHAYDGTAPQLYQGDGERRGARNIGNVVTTFAGNGVADISGDGDKAFTASLARPSGVASGPDGSLYIADRDNSRVRRVGPDGTISTVAGNGNYGFSGDGGPATQAELSSPVSVAFGADGSLYIADVDNQRIRRVGPDGNINTVAGNGEIGYSGDGGLATHGSLAWPESVAVGPDGSLYISDTGNHRIRRVGPDGVIQTAAGIGIPGFLGDGGPAPLARLSSPSGIAIGAEGSIYIVDWNNHRVRHVGPNGIIRTVAGSGSVGLNQGGFSGDGGPATQARLRHPVSVTPDRAGGFYIADTENHRIRHVGNDGIIRTVVGGGNGENLGDGGPATQAVLFRPEGIAVGPDRSLYIADWGHHRVRRDGPLLPGAGFQDVILTSADGNELYHFDRTGRHLRTVDTNTGVPRHIFTYDHRNLLTAITHGDGNQTHIERDGDGSMTAIISPYGLRTQITLDGYGYLATLGNPAGESHHMNYTIDGLLTDHIDPLGNVTAYDYDSDGHLARVVDAAGGGWSLTRRESVDGYEVNVTSAEGRAARYRVEHLPTGDHLRTNLHPDGTAEMLLSAPGAKRTFTSTDGTVSTLEEGPDPRFHMNAPTQENLRIATPGGRASQIRSRRTASLSDTSDLLSHTELTETVTRNNRDYVSRYTAIDRSWRHVTPAGRTLSVVIAPDGRPAHLQLADLAAIAFDYDFHGRLTGFRQAPATAEERAHQLSYDSAGNVASISDPLDRIVSFDHDPAGRVSRKTLPDGRVIDYTFDLNGNLISIIPPGREAHLFEYTPVNLEAQYRPPDIPAIGTVTRYSYNLDKQLIRIDRPDGRALDFEYDFGGRPGAVSSPDGRYLYDYHPATGQLSRITAPEGSALNFTWDGFLPLTETMTGEVSGTVSYGFDDNFWLSTIEVNGDPVTFAYDDDGLMIGAGALTIFRDVLNGFPAMTALGIVTTADAYNGFAEPVSRAVSVGGSQVAETTYARDSLGRITGKSETLSGLATMETYDYDSAGRLVGAIRDSISMVWSYDANGNRTHENGVPIATYDEQDRLLTYRDTSFAYTANGELASKSISGAITEYYYDVLGNLRQVILPGDIVIEYLIDGRNRRIGKKFNGELVKGYLYQDQLNPVAELDGSGNIHTRFVYADNSHVPAYMIKDGVTYRILTDHLGSPRLVIDAANGATVQRIDYDVWGNIISDTHPGFQPFGYAGGILDLHTGLVRFGARDYDPQTGRWTAKDPIRFRSEDANLYGYVLNDPVNHIDPDGKIPVPIATAAVGALVGGIAGGIQANSSGSNIVRGALRGIVVGGATGFFGGAGYGTTRATLSLRFEGGSFGSTVSSVLGSLIGNAVTGIDVISQAQGATCN